MDDWGVCPWAIGVIRINTTPAHLQVSSCGIPFKHTGQSHKTKDVHIPGGIWYLGLQGLEHAKVGPLCSLLPRISLSVATQPLQVGKGFSV